ncbi:MAG: alpha/beta hydrolase [Alphaproteobacteria bacterium]
MNWFKRKFNKRLLVKIFAFYILIVVLMYFFQRSFLYYPFGKILLTPEDFEQINLNTPDNVNIYAWFKKPNKGQKTILYFHGNAGNLMGRSDRFENFSKYFGVLAISYRGYAKSSGTPSENGFYMDAQTALNFLRANYIRDEDIIVFGESIGSAVAINLASKYDFNAMILEAPFTSIYDIAKDTYWFLPVNLILKDRFESSRLASKVKTPVIIFHATKDFVVPFAQGKQLYELFKTEKRFIGVEGDFHIALTADYLIKYILEFTNQINEKENKLKKRE